MKLCVIHFPVFCQAKRHFKCSDKLVVNTSINLSHLALGQCEAKPLCKLSVLAGHETGVVVSAVLTEARDDGQVVVLLLVCRRLQTTHRVMLA